MQKQQNKLEVFLSALVLWFSEKATPGPSSLGENLSNLAIVLPFSRHLFSKFVIFLFTKKSDEFAVDFAAWYPAYFFERRMKWR